jgi:CRP-like cAMP-binding protein
MADDLLRTSRELFLAAVTGASRDTPSWVIDRVTSLMDEEEVEAGRRIFAAGDPIEFVYFMREGRLRLSAEGRPTWTYDGRWVIGPADVMLDRPYQRTAVALTDLNLLKVRADEWIDLLEDSPELVRSAVRNAARAIGALEVRMWSSQADPRGWVVTSVPATERPLSFVDRLATLADIQILRSGGVQVLADLVGLTEERAFASGELLWRRGDAPGWALLLLGGEVVADRVDPALKVRFGPGSVVAGSGSLSEFAGGWEARAITPTRALAIRLEDWFDLMEEHFDLARSALGGFSLRREELLNQLAGEANEILLT